MFCKNSRTTWKNLRSQMLPFVYLPFIFTPSKVASVKTCCGSPDNLLHLESGSPTGTLLQCTYPLRLRPWFGFHVPQPLDYDIMFGIINRSPIRRHIPLMMKKLELKLVEYKYKKTQRIIDYRLPITGVSVRSIKRGVCALCIVVRGRFKKCVREGFVVIVSPQIWR